MASDLPIDHPLSLPAEQIPVGIASIPQDPAAYLNIGSLDRVCWCSIPRFYLQNRDREKGGTKMSARWNQKNNTDIGTGDS